MFKAEIENFYCSKFYLNLKNACRKSILSLWISDELYHPAMFVIQENYIY